MKDILIRERYRIDEKIGEGGFGLVYAGTDLTLNREVAIKLMHVRHDDYGVLETEAETYNALAGGTGIPEVYWFGGEGDYYVMIHELLGASIEDLLNFCGRRFSLKTVLLLAIQAISRIEYIHSKGYLYRDVKPDNFLMGAGKQGNILYAIDFGLAEEFSDSESHKEAGQGRSFIGTRRYASINVHNGHEQSRRDDLESLGYMLIYCFHGTLPWSGLKAANDEEKDRLIKEKKCDTTVESLCQGLPTEFATYITYVRGLGFSEQPNYAHLRNLFDRLFRRKGLRYDNVFDWTEKLFDQLRAADVETEKRPSR